MTERDTHLIVDGLPDDLSPAGAATALPDSPTPAPAGEPSERGWLYRAWYAIPDLLYTVTGTRWIVTRWSAGKARGLRMWEVGKWLKG